MAQLGDGVGSGYPGALDTSTTEVDDPGGTVVSAAKINDTTAAIIAVQTELGADPAGSATNLVTRLAVEHKVDGTHEDVTADSLVLSGKIDNVKAGDLASAGTVNIGAANGLILDITGTTQIDQFDDVTAGILRIIRFDGALTWVHSATETVLPTAANITTAVGDIAICVSEGSTRAWRCVGYLRADGGALIVGADTVTQSSIADGAVGQGELITSTGDISTTSATPTLFTGPGGEFGFYPNVKYSTGATDIKAVNILSSSFNIGTTLLNRFIMNESGAGTLTLRQRFVQASPPYDMGDGVVFSFIFAIVNNATGLIESTYHAPDPPWANNGPTNIRPDRIDAKTGKMYKTVKNIGSDLSLLMNPDFIGETEIEITAAFKNSDMGLIPHPFIGNDLTGKTVILLDPMSSVVERLEELKNAGGDPSEIIYGNFLTIGKTELNRARPPGVMSVSVNMK